VARPSGRDCSSTRALASLALDVELSELERSALASHVRVCAECARFERDIAGLTAAIRAAEHEVPTALPRVSAARRPSRLRRGAAVASALAAASALGAFAAGSQSVRSAPPPKPQLVAQRTLGQDMILMHSERQPFPHPRRWPRTRLVL